MAPYLDDTLSPAPPARAESASVPAAGDDELDDLFDYDAGLDDVFRDLEPPKPAPSNNTSRKDRAGAGLGIDKEVEVTKKPRAPRAKLDENRLLSQAGIPRLRKRAKDLRFKGKGHEYSDAARLLSFYQLWLDDLFPKAKFLDSLAMVEKLGHKRRLRLMRMGWINEGKPREPEQEASIFDEPTVPRREVSDRNQSATRIAPIFEAKQVERPKTPDVSEDVDADIYDATPRGPRTQIGESSTSGEGGSSIFEPKRIAVPNEPEDDLDALLAEQEMEQMSAQNGLGVSNQGYNTSVQEQDFEDDMEAMEELW